MQIEVTEAVKYIIELPPSSRRSGKSFQLILTDFDGSIDPIEIRAMQEAIDRLASDTAKLSV